MGQLRRIKQSFMQKDEVRKQRKEGIKLSQWAIQVVSLKSKKRKKVKVVR